MLLERDGELEVLDGLIDGIQRTGGKVVLIRGEAGIGKSALVGEFIESRRHGAYILAGTCDDLFIPQALGPFWDMARAEQSLKTSIDAGDRPRLLDRVLELLARRDRPTVLIIEDTHWADEATLDAIRYVGRRIGSVNGLLLLTYRDGVVDDDHPLRHVIGDIPAGDVARIRLSGLTLDSVESMIDGSDLDAHRVLRETRGNPLMIRELSTAVDGAVPSSLQDSLAAQMRKLAIATQEALKTLSVIPEPIDRTDVRSVVGVDDVHLDEGARRGLLEFEGGTVAFRHDIIRRAIESSMHDGERAAKFRAVLAGLPEEANPSLLVHCAVEVGDIDRLLELAPDSARYAVAAGAHRQAVEDYRAIGPYLDRLPIPERGSLLDEWAAEEYVVGDHAAAIRVSDAAVSHYEKIGDTSGQSAALARATRYLENDGRRGEAEARARRSVEVLGARPKGSELATAMESEAYLLMMSGRIAPAVDMVDRTIEIGGPGITDVTLIRSLIHKETCMIITDGFASEGLLDAIDRAKAAELWDEVLRAQCNMAWGAAEERDLPVALEFARAGIETAERHELPGTGAYAMALLARALELEGEWDAAADIARDLADSSAISRMVVLPILGVIEARRGRAVARDVLIRGWDLAQKTSEFQRLGPAAIALAEFAWIGADVPIDAADLADVLAAGLRQKSRWSAGKVAYWLWLSGELPEPPPGIAMPYRLVIEGQATEAASIWAAHGMPYERALALMHGDVAERLEAIEIMESLGATAPAGKLRKALRDEGVAVPRGKGRDTRRHAAGLTARQAEVLSLLDEGMSNARIADRLFLSPRTVENHVAAVLDKLDVATREEAVEWARSEGLVAAAN